MSGDLVTWLRAKLDEDERLAHAVSEHLAYGGPRGFGLGPGELPEPIRQFIWNGTPARVLAEVEAKRRRLDVLERLALNPHNDDDFGLGLYGPDGFGADLLRVEALPYADRPGYREEWRP